MTLSIEFRRRIRTLTVSVAAAAMLAFAIPGMAQQPSQSTPSQSTPSAQSSSPVDIRPDATETPAWTVEQLIPLTVSEAWHMSGKNEDKFFDMVQELAAFSAKKRDLMLPEDETAGKQAGEYIKEQAKQDHDQLLYAVVDQAVRKVGKPASTQANGAAPSR